jgi:hypothetical protein
MDRSLAGKAGLAAVLGLALCAAQAQAAETVTLSPDADAKVVQSTPDRTYPATDLRADGAPDPDERSHLKFTVPSGAGAIASAALRVYAFTNTVNGPPVFTTATGWTETGITWNNRPAKTSVRYDDKGAIAAYTWVEYNVTPLVPSAGVYSFLIAQDNSDGVDFSSREAASNRPELVVTYDTMAPSAPTLTATAVSPTTAALSWSESTDDVGVTGYNLYRRIAGAGAWDEIARLGSTARSYTDTTLGAGTAYEFQVRARDAAGNTGSSDIALITTPSGTTVLTLSADADAPVDQATPNTNFATDMLRAEGAPDPDSRSHLNFTVPAGQGSIVSAKLRVYATSGTSDGPTVFTTTTDWTETGITWNNRPAKTSVRHDDKGAIAAGTWVEYEVSPLVTGPGVYSFLIATDSADRVDFASREATANPPELVVTYSSQPSPVIAAAGNIACDPSNVNFNGGLGANGLCQAMSTSSPLLSGGFAAVLALGDQQYEDGTLDKYMQGYDPSWGRVKSITYPVAGNHDYRLPGAAGYFDYFNGASNATGRAGDRSRGYYSFDIGSWHVVALNSNCAIVSCAAGSEQEQWLRADLATQPAKCTLAFAHHPLFSSGDRVTAPAMRPLWDALYEARADLFLVAHSHTYERFAPQTPAGGYDPSNGIVEIVVGTGGESHHPFATTTPNAMVRDQTSFGFLELTLNPTSYAFQFVPTVGSFTDSGAASCH